MGSVLKYGTGFVAGVIVGAGLVLSQGGAFAEPSDTGSADSSDTGGADSSGSANSGPSGTGDTAPAGVDVSGGSTTRLDASSSPEQVKESEDAEDAAWQRLEDAESASVANTQKSMGDLAAEAQLVARASERIGVQDRKIAEALQSQEAALLKAMEEGRAADALAAFDGDPATAVPGSLAAQFGMSAATIQQGLAGKNAAVEDLRKETPAARWGTLAGKGILDQNVLYAGTVEQEKANADKVLQQAAAAESAGQDSKEVIAQMESMMADIRGKLLEIQQAETEQMRALVRG